MACILDHDLIEFMDFIEDLEEEPKLPKRYVRDRENPLEFYNEQQFYERYTFTKDTFLNGILPILTIGSAFNDRGLPVPVLLQVLVAIRFYTTGDFQLVLGDLRGISQPTVSRILKRISEDLARKIRYFVRFPNAESEIQINKTHFQQLSTFPEVAAVIGCTHIPIKNPGGQFAEMYKNCQSWTSLNVQLACGPNMEILNIVSRWSGSTPNNKVFHNSAIKQQFEDGRIQGVLLGDSSYPQMPYLFTPILDKHIRTAAERRYNSAHEKTRNIMDRTIGVLKQRFQCLRKKLCTKMRTTQAIIVSCAVLHNIGIRWKDFPDEIEEKDPVVSVPSEVQNHPEGNIIRQKFIEKHFSH